MNAKFLKILGVCGLAASCFCLVYGADMSVNEVASLVSKILGVVGSLVSGVLTFLGFKNKGDKD